MNQLLRRDCVGRFFLVALSLLLATLLVGCGVETEAPKKMPTAGSDASPAAEADAEDAQPEEAEVADAEETEQADQTAEAEQTTKVTSCDGQNTAEVDKDLSGAPLARALMEQWKRDNPNREWVDAEKEAHALTPPADNSDVLEGGQAEGHAYGNFTERDLLTWRRETEQFVAEGSRIFHNAGELGSTIAVSCDMCHPHASNTHPETYPKYQTQLGRVALLRDMINWCVQHPVRGQPLDPDGPKMRALESYIAAERKGVEMNYGKH